ncbi:type II toxin-antitoxin system HicB family antitoxin [Candidatus Roizmanbacteria bacterium CG_4_10_14_0_2_um_filter_39_13]|uniref:Type II toxin-antitoxin system HicB family antitoxin n=1 Tax=Candidatus Roizmanbacteria bacterium CG_4_10_14_0_2_um_filter_39_13 TaxID=1974825 RepID=A0A2M7TXT7_9BACT|nr:MAG: type II toxin-antitoxin system HicB family antitoxin [Candidatus Roizmanbacteria bacterium CG_4_10_14_0_2_um_filter_39_13]
MAQKNVRILQYDVIFEEAEEGGYSAYVPTLPGCISEGDSFEEVKTNIQEAITAYLESLEKDEIKDTFESTGNTMIGRVDIPYPKTI